MVRTIVKTVEAFNPVARDFVQFCVHRKGKAWPSLYDEMCWVAGRRLFRGMGYPELRDAGLSFSLAGMENTHRLVDSIFIQE